MALGERYTATSRCVECAKVIARAHSAKPSSREKASARRQTEEFKAKFRVWRARYNASAKGKAKNAEYAKRESVKARAAAYMRSEKGREYVAKANSTEKRRAYMRMYMAQPKQIAAKRFYKARRDAHVSAHATPIWNDKAAMAAAYAEAKRLTAETGAKYVVDHIVPLKSDIVCGLHAHTNLRVIPEVENLKKNNRFDERLAVG